jgi:L-alanine-DL-glutamate epimerase-like enolase superfamily enzyme
VQVTVNVEPLRLREPFRISDRIFDMVDTVVVTVSADGFQGRGEAQGIYYLGETGVSIQAQIAGLPPSAIDHLTRDTLQHLLPPGGARNALDCALWDLECKKARRRVWELIGVEPRPLRTAYTIGFEPDVEAMVLRATQLEGWPLLKVKLGADDPIARMAAIRRARPDAELMVDANQAWTFAELQTIAPDIAALGVTVIEQPLRRNGDSQLERYRSPVPLCADESCLNLQEIDIAAKRYQLVNIKLDKAGGLTEALQMVRAIRARNVGVMVGNMGGSSLSMAPSFVIGLMADTVDLDGPLDLVKDRENPLQYQLGIVSPPSSKLWG